MKFISKTLDGGTKRLILRHPVDYTASKPYHHVNSLLEPMAL